MLVIGILDVIDFVLGFAEHNPSATFLNSAVPFFNVLPNILISRLMLSLRVYETPEEMSRASQSAGGQQNSGLRFATNSFLGNIGAPLDSESIDEEREDGEIMEEER
ncbi:hypothetical protein GYMLUDRAFT_250993 [Collybiopsis luxurians FD-317 M1]|uniref:Uncharacterized protein n=1 Tax=Collybiopsis luxurians FD-317 M1 TaxID=944289 RepID=A0A0D0BSZ7_9AGAR|nr:hypothetical protein GYMLUDRAFT_250993 [Collybiopsis luxurians FD-317 M1]